MGRFRVSPDSFMINLTAKLTNWDKERGQNPDKPDTSAIMEPIAHGLNQAQIKAVASYLSYLE